mmetsp:Transcript_103090/g.269139  ORF Transcript_103090/g.269139 Transcript_103090/m.269139 type:complete len:360 (-) Transcript_103090:49-1128(-)
MNPKLTMSAWYCGPRLRPRTMPSAASWSPAWLISPACKTAASEASQPEASSACCTLPQSVEQAQMADRTAARVSFGAGPTPLEAVSNAAMSAPTPPCSSTVRQNSSLAAKLPKHRQTAITSGGRSTHLFKVSTSSVMPPPWDRVRRCRVRFASSARAVTASSRTASSTSRYLRSRSTTRGTVPRRLMMTSEFSMALRVATASRQHRVSLALAAWAMSNVVAVESRPFCTATAPLAASSSITLQSTRSTAYRQPKSASGASVFPRSHEQSAAASLCWVCASTLVGTPLASTASTGASRSTSTLGGTASDCSSSAVRLSMGERSRSAPGCGGGAAGAPVGGATGAWPGARERERDREKRER